jgi:hypothetical protein
VPKRSHVSNAESGGGRLAREKWNDKQSNFNPGSVQKAQNPVMGHGFGQG